MNKSTWRTAIIISLSTSVVLGASYLLLPEKYKTKISQMPQNINNKVKKFFSTNNK